jgi:two-component system cell cycle sensor histidine kinase/response regulator CckA
MKFLRSSNPVRRNGPLKVLGVYFLYSTAWIVITDSIVHRFFPHSAFWHTAKGLLFLLTSGAILYTLLRRMLDESNRFENTLSEIFRQSEFGIYLGDSSGTMLDCNNAFANIVGLPRADVIGTPIAALVHVDDRDRFHEEWKRISETASTGEHVQRIRFVAENRQTWVVMTISRISDATSGSFMIALTQNISAEVKAFGDLKEREGHLEETLNTVQRSELRFRRLVEANFNATAICRLDGTIVDANSAFCKIVGRSEEDIRRETLTLWSITPPEFHEVDRETLRQLQTTDRFCAYEKEITSNNGARIPVLASGALLSEPVDGHAEAAISLLDLRDAKTKEAQLSRLVIAVENAHECIVITDVAANIVYVNPAFENLTGYLRAEVQGKNPRFLRSGRTAKHQTREMWATLRRGEVWHGTFHNQRKDGTEYEEDATVTPVRNSRGEVINYLAVKRDVTRERELEEQLLQSQKMEAIGQLASGVAHDLNNVLQVVQSSAELALWKAEVAHSRRKLQDILHASERGAGIVSQLLAFSRQQKRFAHAIDLNDMIVDNTRLLRRLLPEDVEIQIDLGKELPKIEGDISQITQIMLNMAVNARDALPKGGTFCVTTRCEVLEASSASARSGRFVKLSISDNGCGIEPQVLKKMFEPFFTTKGPGKGTGLGLSTVYGIMKQSGGTITVDTLPGEGTTFHMLFPATDAAETARNEETQDVVPRLEGTVLVCDDDPAVRAAIREHLESIGATAVCCATSDEAIGLAVSASPTLLITDIVMPGMSGVELAEKVKQLCAGLKVLFITGHSHETITQRYDFNENTSFLQKPFTAKSLMRQLNELNGSSAANVDVT